MRTIPHLIVASTICLSWAARAADGAEAESSDPLETCNVVWETPSENHNGSMPIGNGDIGMNVWAERNGDLWLLLSKSDAWSENGRLLKLGRLRVRLSPNPFVAGARFRQVLHLRQGAITIEAGKGEKAVTLMAHKAASTRRQGSPQRLWPPRGAVSCHCLSRHSPQRP